jgi:transposase-like protein
MSKSSRPRSQSRWTAEQARSVLAEWEHSGLSVAQFARRRGLEAERLYRWQRRLDAAVPSRFVEMTTETSTGELEIVLRSGHHVMVRGRPDEVALKCVVRVLEDQC